MASYAERHSADSQYQLLQYLSPDAPPHFEPPVHYAEGIEKLLDARCSQLSIDDDTRALLLETCKVLPKLGLDVPPPSLGDSSSYPNRGFPQGGFLIEGKGHDSVSRTEALDCVLTALRLVGFRNDNKFLTYRETFKGLTDAAPEVKMVRNILLLIGQVWGPTVTNQWVKRFLQDNYNAILSDVGTLGPSQIWGHFTRSGLVAFQEE